MIYMATDLQKILSISGEHGLFRYLSQGRNGIIAESLETGRRTVFGMSSKVTALSDISIYTDDGEISLKDVFVKMKEMLSEEEAPSPKSGEKAITGFFAQAVPDYDRNRFYVSHMKKVLGWYSLLKRYASLDFTEEEKEKEEGGKE